MVGCDCIDFVQIQVDLGCFMPGVRTVRVWWMGRILNRSGRVEVLMSLGYPLSYEVGE